MMSVPRAVTAVAPLVVILSCLAGDRVTAPSSPIVATDATSAATASEAFTGTAGALTTSWTQQRTSGTINRNGTGVGVGSVNAKDLFAFWNATAFSNDQYSQARIVGGLAGGTQYVQIIVRANGKGDGVYSNYLFYTDGFAGAGHTEVAKNINGSQITLRSFSTSFAAGDVIKISAVGNTITCYKNGVAVGSITDSSLPTGAPGIGVYGSSVTVDDWEGASVITSPPAPVAAVGVSPATANLAPGATQQFTATTTDASGTTLTGRTVTWSSDATSVASVDPSSGLVTAVGSGQATITAASEGKSGTASVTVAPKPVATVVVTPSSTTIAIPNTQQLTAVTKDDAGAVLSGRAIAWSSDNPAAATVDANGLVTAVSTGTATITATSEGKSGTSTVTVTPVAVSTVTVTPSTATVMERATQQLTATTRDANNNELTGRTVKWSSGNPAIATVDANGLVTGVAAGGPVSISATSEGKTGSASITVTPIPVASVTVNPPSFTVAVGGAQSLSATTRDANNNVLTGRAVSWSSDAPSVASVNTTTGVVTGVSTGYATITATSEGASGRSSATVTPASTALGPLRVSSRNRRYFETPAGQIVYLTGAHTWSNFQDNGTTDPPAVFNYSAYLDFLSSRGHNFFRLWAWEQSKWTAEISSDYWFSPAPYLRTGPGNALDGKPKFDLNQFDQAYFDRLRSRVQQAGARGIYVSIMLFDGWSITTKPGNSANNPWKGHPFNTANNVNGINGDANGDGIGPEIQTLTNATITALQDAYVRKVIDAINDLDNVLYEIDNEGESSSKPWQYHIIQVIRDYETTKPKQHPIGMTAIWPGGSDADLYGSAADWISPAGALNTPAVATGEKVIIGDTDHICGVCGNVAWVWQSLTRGQNPILMDGYDGAAIGVGASGFNPSNPVWEAIRKNMGYARTYANRVNMSAAAPRGDLSSTGYCLAVVGSEYVAFQPSGGSLSVNLTGFSATFTLEWFNPTTGQAVAGGTVRGGGWTSIRAPFSGASVAYIHL